MLYREHILEAHAVRCGAVLNNIVVDLPENCRQRTDALVEEKHADMSVGTAAIASYLKGKLLYVPYEGLARVGNVTFDGTHTSVHARHILTARNIRVIAGPWSSADNSYIIKTKRAADKLIKLYKASIIECFRDMQLSRRESARRSAELVAYGKASRKRVGRELSVMLATVKKTDDVDLQELRDLLNELRRDKSVRRDVLLKFAQASSDVAEALFVCPDCEAVEWMDDSGWTSNDESVCCSCIESYCYSDRTGVYIPEDRARPLYTSVRSYNRDEPDDWVNRDDTSDYRELYYENNAYFDADTYYELFDNDNDDDEDEDDGLHGYHSAHRNFVEQSQDKRFVPLGVELEVYADNRYDAVQSIRSNARFNDTYLERDGSLDDDHGFEIITQPLGKVEWETFAPALLNTLMDNKVLGYNHRDTHTSYGIHISINREYLSPLQEARMSLFLTATENEGFVKAIAQRNAIYGGSTSIQIGSIGKTEQRVSRVGGLGSYNKGKKKIYGMGKYSPLNLKNDVAECRIFQSTLHPQSFMKNLEFIWALVEWTNVKSATGSSWLHTDFVQWLAARPGSDVDFGNLTAYLRKDQYIVKRGVGAIANTWAKLLPRITTKSHPTEVNVEEQDEEAVV
jgi:hypothetical protein